MRKIDALQIADTFDVLMTKLEAFGDHFEHLATTADQRELAAEFNAFVGEIIQAMLSPGKAMGHLAPIQEAFHEQHGHETLSGLFAEIRGDEAAGKRENAHRRKETLKEILGGKTKTPAVEMRKDKEIER